MTSEEVKELLRQLSKDTQEIGGMKSRTVRIRLGGDEESEEAGAGADGTQASGQDPELNADISADTDEIPDTAGRPDTDEPWEAPVFERKLTDSGKVHGSGSDEGETGSGRENDPEEETAPLPEPDEADELVTRYMDEEEKRAYLEEKAGLAVSGARRRPDRTMREPEGRSGRGLRGNSGRRTPAQGKKQGGFAAFVEQCRNTPVEPAAFEEDAWMFRSQADPDGGGEIPDAAREEGFDATREEDLVTEREEGADTTVEEARTPFRKKTGAILSYLGSKGFGLKELSVIGSIIVLALLVIAIVLTLLGNKRKSARVTAEEGLRITVEQEPSTWCKSGDVTLAVRADSPIQSIAVNNEPLSFAGDGRVYATFTAEENPVNVLVVSEDRARTATVGFAKIDHVDPTVNVSFREEDGTIAFEASDEDSGIDTIWYGTKDGLSDVPSYVPYEGPFVPEKGKLYSYFAVDKAGNASAPVTTNLMPATSISLNRDEISIFAGQTYQLELSVTPERAFLNDLTWSSSDEQTATVDDTGLVTALKDGEAVITASAAGVEDADCIVRVRSEVSVTISAVGDVTLGEDVSFSTTNNFTSVYTLNGPSYFLENVRDIFESDDITFANLEGTLTDQGERVPKEYAFRGDPAYVQVLTEGSVEAVTLANNHSHDYGEISHTDTQKYLDEAGIDWCEGDTVIIKDVNGVRMALIGIYELDEGQAKAEQVQNCIAKAKEEGAQLIVVAFHWGNERETKPDQTQKYLAHLAIDSGADLVVGHHPHVLQGIEKYSGKYICYSLGNFCFGGNSNPTDKDTAIFQQTFRIDRSGNVEDAGVSVIPCSISSTPDWNNYQPTPATGEEAERIMTKLNELCEPLGTAF